MEVFKQLDTPTMRGLLEKVCNNLKDFESNIKNGANSETLDKPENLAFIKQVASFKSVFNSSSCASQTITNIDMDKFTKTIGAMDEAFNNVPQDLQQTETLMEKISSNMRGVANFFCQCLGSDIKFERSNPTSVQKNITALKADIKSANSQVKEGFDPITADRKTVDNEKEAEHESPRFGGR